ncbi:MAG: hypothetical protein FJ149_08565 [Euryarchaeota archaeon]|nr:hypothetical protein [Euryarchaeota archaeon]
MSDDAATTGAVLEREARAKLDDYLKWIRKDLKEVDGGERNAILLEVEGAIREKLEILATGKGAGKVDGGMVDNVLDAFGSPSEVAREYTGVARVVPGRALKAFMAMEAIFAVVLGGAGAKLLWEEWDNTSRGWGTDPAGVIWGAFWLVLMGTMLASLWLQSRKRERVLELGPFTLITLLAFGLCGLVILSDFRWQLAWYFGVDDQYIQDLLLAALTVTMIVMALAGTWLIWRFARAMRSSERQTLLPARGRFSRGGKLFIAVSSVLLISIFVAGNHTWLYNPYSLDRPEKGDERFIMSQPIGGPYNATVQKVDYFDGESWVSANKIIYTVDGKEVEGWFGLDPVKAMDWMRDNTPENATIVAWWDQSICIRGYTGRNCTIYYPSDNLMHTVWDPSTVKGREPYEKVRLTALVYMAENASQLRAATETVGAHYIYVNWQYSSGIAYALLQGAGKDVSRYLDTNLMNTQGRYLPTPAGENLFLFKVWKGDFEGARIVYRDIDNLVVEVD